MLAFKNVHFAYEENKWVLNDVSFEVREGEFVSIIGCNGSGKSTIARLSSGLLVSQKGEVAVCGKSFNNVSERSEARAKVGIVFQNPDNQFIGMTVEEDMAFGLENYNVNRLEAHRRIEEISSALKITNYLSFAPSLLSGGEKQKVAIASALVLYPKYLVLDEITSLLDPQSRADIINLVKLIANERNIALIYITHKPEETLTSDKVLVLYNGRVLISGEPMDVFKNVPLLEKVGVATPSEPSLSYKLKEAEIIKNIHFKLEDILKEI
ncbi:MAG: ATP-binding cassette domain-containing protein [Caldisericaceae bacterium]